MSGGGTLAISWGRYGGFYIHRARICLGWFALTWVPIEIDDLMRAYTEAARVNAAVVGYRCVIHDTAYMLTPADVEVVRAEYSTYIGDGERFTEEFLERKRRDA